LTDADKKNFKTMMDIVMSLYGRKPCETETLRYWFGHLDKFELSVVSASFDKWIDTKSELPTVHDIKTMCKPVTPIYTAIARKTAKEAGKQYAKEVVDFVAERLTPKRDLKDWARRIIGAPGNYPDISLKLAKEALRSE